MANNPKERDILHWIETKIHSSSSINDEKSAASSSNLSSLWGCRHVTQLLNAELLSEIQSCFVDLQTPVKLKLLLCIIHLSRRSLDQVVFRNFVF